MKCKEPAGTQSGAKSAWEVVRQLSSDKKQSTLFTRSEIPWRFRSQAVLRWLSGGLCHARKCQLEDLDKKKRYDLQSPNGHLHEKPLERKAERGKNAGTNPVTRFPWSSYFEKTRKVCQKHGGACTTWYPEYKRYENGIKIGVPRNRERCKETSKKRFCKNTRKREKTMFTLSNPNKATNPIVTA